MKPISVAIVRRICRKRYAAGFFAEPHLDRPEDGFQNSRTQKRPKRVRGRSMGIVPLRERTPGNPNSSRCENGSDRESSQDFKAAMTIGVIVVGGLGGNP